jgi:hypothetical protein
MIVGEISMQITELRQTIEQLPLDQRLMLLNVISESVQRELYLIPSVNKLAIVDQLRGSLKRSDAVILSDADIEMMREERLERYL